MSFGYDAADRVTSQTLPGSRTVSYGYDANGNLTSLTPPGGSTHTFAYTPVDLNSTYTPPTVSGITSPATSYAFSYDRQLTQVTRPDSATVTLSYGSSSGKLTTLTHPRGASQFYYKAASAGGLPDSISSADTVTVHYTYDGPLLTKETWTGKVSGSLERWFNRDFRDSVQRVNDADPIAYLYDADGLLVGAGTEFIERRSDNGLVHATKAGVVTSYHGYNEHGEPDTLRYERSGANLFQQVIERDALGRITKITESGMNNAVYEYRYDTAGRLDQVKQGGSVVQTLEYDGNQAGNGNRTKFTGATSEDTAAVNYDEQDRLTQYDLTVYRYTANGELKYRITGTDTTATTYDALGNLVEAKLPAGTRIAYRADGLNRRVERKVDGAVERRWLYEGPLSVAAELDGASAVLNRYVYGTRGHVPDLLLRASASPSAGYRLITDQLGSVRAVVDTATGAIVQRTDYDAWGVAVKDSNAAFQSLGYAGGIRDASTGLVRFGARDYEPRVGRWTCKDPIGFGGGDGSLFAYVRNRPIDFADPSGQAVAPPSLDPQGASGSASGSRPSDPIDAVIYQAVGTALDIWRIKQSAIRSAGLVDPQYQNAVRHGLAAQRIACKYGVIISVSSGMINEVRYPLQYLDLFDTSIDLMNNSIGAWTSASVDLVGSGWLLGGPPEGEH